MNDRIISSLLFWPLIGGVVYSRLHALDWIVHYSHFNVLFDTTNFVWPSSKHPRSKTSPVARKTLFLCLASFSLPSKLTPFVFKQNCHVPEPPPPQQTPSTLHPQSSLYCSPTSIENHNVRPREVSWRRRTRAGGSTKGI